MKRLSAQHLKQDAVKRRSPIAQSVLILVRVSTNGKI